MITWFILSLIIISNLRLYVKHPEINSFNIEKNFKKNYIFIFKSLNLLTYFI